MWALDRAARKFLMILRFATKSLSTRPSGASA
jgi:hypothetical protein